jgi:hypothetical protein
MDAVCGSWQRYGCATQMLSRVAPASAVTIQLISATTFMTASLSAGRSGDQAAVLPRPSGLVVWL